jgi:peptidoglycan/xylan/chitin deacetylase (PgdA/CDA1 family)
MIAALLYHDVLTDADPASSGFTGPGADIYKLTLPAFDAHLNALSSSAAAAPVVVGRDDGKPALRESAHASPVPSSYGRSGPSFALTFDDGGISAHDVIAPALERLGWSGHFFVTTDYLGAPAFLDVDHVRSLHAQGHVIGSHSCSHPERMAALGTDELDEEWSRSVAVLSDIVGDPVRTASVPNGYYNRAVARSAARAGIRWLYTSEPTTRVDWVDGCAVIGRFNVQASTPPHTVADLVAPFSWTRRKQQLHWTGKKVAKRVGGTAYLRLRATLLRGR